MNAQRTFPLDIGAVKAYGVDRWRAEFSWPVSDQEFVALARAIRQTLRDILATSTGDTRNALLIGRGIIFELEHLLHARLVVDRLRSRGYAPCCAPGAPWYSIVLRQSNDAPALLNRSAASRRAFVRQIWRRPTVLLRRWSRDIGQNASLQKWHALLRLGRTTWIYGAPDPFQREYLRRTARWIATFYDDALPPRLGLVQHDDVRAIAVMLVDRIQNALADRVVLHEDDRTYLRHVLGDNLAYASLLLARARALRDRTRMEQLYVPAFGSVMQRALAVAVREAGGSVTSFAHGGFSGLFNTPSLSLSEFALSDAYVTYTAASAALCEEIQRTHTPLVPNDTRIINGQSGYFRRLHARLATLPPRTVRTVMLVGFPMGPWRKSNGGAAFAPMQLDFELRCIDALRSAGYTVLYKVHPDRLTEVIRVFTGRCRVVTEDFLVAHRLADAYVFGCMRTTAFSIALCTTKPIIGVLMDTEPASPFPDALALLDRRCTILRGAFDERNRISVDFDAMCRVLASAPAVPNHTFLATHLIGAAV